MKEPASPSAMETCPFCGRSFKRLKSHLPHCKSANSRKNEDMGANCPGLGTAGGQSSMKRTNLKKEVLPNTRSAKERGKVKGEIGSERGLQDSRLANSKPAKANVKGEAMSESLEKHGLNSSNDLGLPSADRSLGDPSSHVSGPGGKVTSSSNQGREVLLQAAPGPSLCEGKRPNLREEHLGNDRASRLPTTFQKDARQRELLALLVDEEVASDGEGRRGELLAAGKTLVWEHIQSSLGRRRHFENWGEVFKQVPPPQIPHFCDSTANIPLKGLDNLSGGVSAAQFLHPRDLNSTQTKPSVVVKESDDVSRLDPASKGELVTSRPSAGGASGGLGMQWFPELYPNYVHLHMISERQDQWSMEGRGIRTKMSPDTQQDIPLSSRPLMDVRLGELPSWLTNKQISIRSLQKAAQTAWHRYYNKYVNVRRGGVGGLTMLLAGYCVLSYTWSYRHIRQDRRRKYH